MGITGTDVTKETADMVLADDNFASMVNAVEEGRVVFESVRKVVKYLMSTNAGEIITIIGALLFLPEIPLIFTPVQILWVNLVTDGLLDKFLAMEPKEEGSWNNRQENQMKNNKPRYYVQHNIRGPLLWLWNPLDFHYRLECK